MVFIVTLIQLKLRVCLTFLIRGYILNDQSTTSLQNLLSINVLWWCRELPIVNKRLSGVALSMMLVRS